MEMPKDRERFGLSCGGFSDVSMQSDIANVPWKHFFRIYAKWTLAKLQASINVASFSPFCQTRFAVICLRLNFPYHSVWTSSHQNSSFFQMAQGSEMGPSSALQIVARFCFYSFRASPRSFDGCGGSRHIQTTKQNKLEEKKNESKKRTTNSSSPTRSERKLQNQGKQSQSSQSKGMWHCTQALELHCALWAQQRYS